MVNAVPTTPAVVPSVSNTDIKVATPDLIQFNEDNVSVEYMTDLLFENVGGQELISISRNDIVNGQKILYNPIKNVTQINASFNSLNMFPNTGDTDSVFKNYTIQLSDKVPEIGTNSSANEVTDISYIDPGTGNLIVNVINMYSDELVEIQILNGGNLQGDIIY